MGEDSPEEYVPEHRADAEDDGNSIHGLVTDKTYDRLKFLSTIVLPALTGLYLTLAPLWHLPKQEEVAATITAINVFLGVIVGVSSKKHQNDPKRFAGKVVYQDTGDKEPEVNLVLKQNLKEFQGRKEVTFKIVDHT